MSAGDVFQRRAPGIRAVAIAALAVLTGCAHVGRLSAVSSATNHVPLGSLPLLGMGLHAGDWRPMFADTTLGLVGNSADSSKRLLGRLRYGYTADTLNIILLGDNRPGHRTTRLTPEYVKLQRMFKSPAGFFTGLATVPLALVKGLYPDLALIRDIPGRLRHMPTWGPERKVTRAIVAKIDSLEQRGEKVAAVINTGDLVNDGRYPAHWQRFLQLNHPLITRVPYFPVAGNHERTDDLNGIENWRAATGLPVEGDRLYYCFDSADGWVRFIALDSNPMADPAGLWTREVQIKYSDEEINWMIARLKEHEGPVFVFMHHPPFSVGFHHDEWQADSVLSNRRERMVRAMHEAGIGVIAAGHEHAYERALFRWPDAVLIAIVTGGGGAPLHALPPPAESARLFAQYRVAGSTVSPDNVVTGSFNNFIHLRLWFGGGELNTYAVDHRSRATLADKVRIDLTRYGTPAIDEHKVPIPKAKATPGPHEEEVKKPVASADSIANSQRILTSPPPQEITRVSRTTQDDGREGRATAPRGEVTGGDGAGIARTGSPDTTATPRERPPSLRTDATARGRVPPPAPEPRHKRVIVRRRGRSHPAADTLMSQPRPKKAGSASRPSPR